MQLRNYLRQSFGNCSNKKSNFQSGRKSSVDKTKEKAELSSEMPRRSNFSDDTDRSGEGDNYFALKSKIRYGLIEQNIYPGVRAMIIHN